MEMTAPKDIPELAARIRAYRAVGQMGQEEAAKSMNMSVPTLKELEAGNVRRFYNMSLRKAFAMAKTLGITNAELAEAVSATREEPCTQG